LNSHGSANGTRASYIAPEPHQIRMRDDTVADVDREIVGRIARTPLRHEEKVPGAIVCRAGLRTGDKCEQATRGYRISEKVFHHLLQNCGRCFRRSKELLCPSDPTTGRGRPVLGGKDRPRAATAKGRGAGAKHSRFGLQIGKRRRMRRADYFPPLPRTGALGGRADARSARR
jgi:hypothetical protein